ncbi:hypothetical protein CEXT_511071 [Caerostris extrusa]|uniref:Uncharacterized protein n=1 Tax=Caerostris extrusa TaxID=172846 RepID=A0AAV4P5Z7_CAEEX|nr:hypothetical protein CEXT_511071 [Caerostris extrusa]
MGDRYDLMLIRSLRILHTLTPLTGNGFKNYFQTVTFKLLDVKRILFAFAFVALAALVKSNRSKGKDSMVILTNMVTKCPLSINLMDMNTINMVDTVTAKDISTSSIMDIMDTMDTTDTTIRAPMGFYSLENPLRYSQHSGGLVSEHDEASSRFNK